MKYFNKVMFGLLAICLGLPTYNTLVSAKEEAQKTISNTDTIYYQLQNDIVENNMRVTMPFDDSLSDYHVTWRILEEFNTDNSPIYFQNEDTKKVSSITTEFNTVNLYFQAPGTSTVEVSACRNDDPGTCMPKKVFYVNVANPQLSFAQDMSELRYLQEEDTLSLKLNEQDGIVWEEAYDITWRVEDDTKIKLYDPLNDRYTNTLRHASAQANIQSIAKGNSEVRVDIVHKENANIKASAILDVYVKDLLVNTEIFVNNDDIKIEQGCLLPYYTDKNDSESVKNTATNQGLAAGFIDARGQVNFDTYRHLIKFKINDESVLRYTPYVKYNGRNIPLDQANAEAKKGRIYYAFEGLKPGSTTIVFSYGEKTVSVKVRVSEKLNNEIALDPVGEVKSDSIDFFVSEDALDSVTSDDKPSVVLNLTKSAIDSLIISSKQPKVTVNIRIPAAVRKKADMEQILISKNTMEAARNYKKEIVFRITNESDKLLYSWSFEGAKIREVGYDLNLAIEKRSIKEVYKIDILAQDANATVVNFKHEGDLPTSAKVKLYVGDIYQPKDVLYFYYYDQANNQLLDEAKENNGYVVDKEGYVQLEITHCSDYVLTTKALKEEELEKGKVNEFLDQSINPAQSDSLLGFTGANTGVIPSLILFLVLMMLAELGYVLAKKYCFGK